MNRARTSRARGFSLIEVVVALAIMSIALGILYRALGGSVRSIGDLSNYTQAVIVAESVLQSHDAIAAEGLRVDGESDGFRWVVASQPYSAADGNDLSLNRIQVVVSWGDGLHERSFSLVSLRPRQVQRAAAEGS